MPDYIDMFLDHAIIDILEAMDDYPHFTVPEEGSLEEDVMIDELRVAMRAFLEKYKK